jgi:hypothetical protein
VSAAAAGQEQRFMEMKKVNGGNVRAVGYDERNRALRVELSTGTFEYANISPELYRRLIGSSSMASFFRDNIEEEFTGRRVK